VDNETIPLNGAEKLQQEDDTGEDPQQTAALPDFPEEAFTGLFKSYRDLVEPCTEAPAPYHWVTFLTMTGLLLGRNVFIRSPFPLYPNFYSLLVGSTGLNRKSTTMTFGVREILHKIPNNIVYVPGALSSEGIYEELSKRDATRLLLYCDEMRSFLTVANRQGTSDIIPRLNTLYGCPDNDGLTRRGQSTVVKFPFVSLIAGTPKEWLTSAIGDGEIMGGFINRFMCVEGVSDRDVPFPPQPDAAASRHFIEELNKRVDHCSNSPVEMKWSAGAQTLYQVFYCAWRERQRSRSGETAAITNRITDHVVRIAMMYSVLEGHAEITDNTIATAIKIGEYLEGTALNIFGDTGVSTQGRIERMIITRLENNGGSMGLRELRLDIGGKADTNPFNQALLNLEKADMIRILPPLSDAKNKQKKFVFLLRT
jgi:hypothetical protein